MAKKKTKGKCQLCGGVFSRAKMTEHLISCLAEEEAKGPLTAQKGGRRKPLFLLEIEGRGQPEYWLRVEMAAEAKLEDLDELLREIWLECCGHLSAFTIGKVRYSVSPMAEYGEKRMNAKLEAVLKPGMEFLHEYDFGSTTELALKVVSERAGRGRGKAIRVLARNDPPEIKCVECGNPAQLVCTQCMWDDEGWLCEACVETHECGDEMCLPVVNSPRVGVCGYCGP